MNRVKPALGLLLLGLMACEPTTSDPGPADAGADATPAEDMAPAPDAAPTDGLTPDGAPPADGDVPGDMAPDAAAPDDMAPPDMAPPDMMSACVDGDSVPCEADGCPGRQTCAEGAFGPCAVPAEACNGLDDDCDGAVDEVEGAGAPCLAGDGRCAAEGVQRCGPEGGLICDAVEGEPGEEVCSTGADEDCDGAIDEDECAGCRDDIHCPLGTLCLGGQCPPADCRADAVCPAGALCIDNVCTEAECREDADCGEGMLCSLLGCRPIPAACAEPTVIDAPGVFEGSTADAAAEVEATCASGARSPEAVYLLDLALDGPVCLSTIGSDYDTALHAQAVCGDADTEVACEDDLPDFTLQTQLELDGGSPVFVFVDGFGAFSRGAYVLSVEPGPCPCLGDRFCADGEVCRGGACAAVECGDGRREGAEACDDGGLAPGDGCDAACAVERGFECRPALDPEADPAPDRCRPAACEADVTCLADELCEGGRCVPGACRLAVDCADGETCDRRACAPAPERGAVRLADGEGDTGVVEVFVDDAWGSVCAEGFVALDGAAVCRQLGLGDLWRTAGVVWPDALPPALSGVDCPVGAPRLIDCPADAQPPARCPGDEVASVVCLRPCADNTDCPDGEYCRVDACRPAIAEVCEGGVDEDADGLIDCADDDCLGDLACPCAGDDAFEDANDAAPGAPIEAGTSPPMLWCDDDLYSVEVCPGGLAVATVLGGVDAVLVDALAEVVVDEGRPRPGGETLSFANAGDGPALLTLALVGEPEAVTYTVDLRLFGCDEGAELCDAPGDEDLDGAADCDDVDCFRHPACPPPADACDAVRRLDGPGRYVGDTRDRPATHGETDPRCIGGERPAQGPEAVFVFTAEADGPVCLTTTGSAFDTVLYVRADACDEPAGEVACNDDDRVNAGGLRSAVTLDAQAGVDYFVFVDGYLAGSAGPFALNLFDGPCAPPVEICDNGVDDDLDPAVDCDQRSCADTAECIASRCGNGRVDTGERCDDGNTEAGDGCAADCRQQEPGFACNYVEPTTRCRPVQVCGDGIVDVGEVCDGGRGCDSLCSRDRIELIDGVESHVVDLPPAAGDGFTFRADADSRLVVRAGAPGEPCPGDVATRLFVDRRDGARGEPLAVGAPDGDGGCPALDMPLSAGLYEAVVANEGPEAVRGLPVGFRLEVPIEDGDDAPGAILPGGSDLYTLAVDAPTRLALTLSEGEGACPAGVVRVVRAYGSEDGDPRIAAAFDPCAELAVDLGRGRYEVVVYGNGLPGAVAYTLHVRATPTVCGDGVVEGAEACDDGDDDPTDGCDALCTPTRYATDRAIDALELDVEAGASDGVIVEVDHDPSTLEATLSDAAGGCVLAAAVDVVPLDEDGARGAPVARVEPGDCAPLTVDLPAGPHEVVVHAPPGADLRGLTLDLRLSVDIGAGGVFDGFLPVGGDDLYRFATDRWQVLRLQVLDPDGQCGDADALSPVLHRVHDGGGRERLPLSAGARPCPELSRSVSPGRYVVVADIQRQAEALAYALHVVFEEDGVTDTLNRCEEYCADLLACFDDPPDPDCFADCRDDVIDPRFTACVAAELDPDAGACDRAALERCGP